MNPENAPASSLTTALPSPAQATTAATSRGAELYRSLGCANCHGDTRNVPGRLQIGVIDERAKRLIREGSKNGMPAYPPDILNDQDFRTLLDYLYTLTTH